VTRALVPLYTPDAQERRQREQIADAIPRPGLLDPTIRTQDFTAVPGGTYRIAGAAVRVMLPQPAPELFGKTVTLFLESGAVSVWQAGVASQLSGLSSVGRYTFHCSLLGWRIDQLPDTSVTTGEIANGAITTAKLANNAVTLAKMADNSVGTAELVDSNVTTAKLANSAVTYAKQDQFAKGWEENISNPWWFDDFFLIEQLTTSGILRTRQGNWRFAVTGGTWTITQPVFNNASGETRFATNTNSTGFSLHDTISGGNPFRFEDFRSWGCRVRLRTTVTSIRLFCGVYLGGAAAAAAFDFEQTVSANLRARTLDGGGSGTYDQTTGTAWGAGDSHHLRIEKNGSSDLLFYVDGTLTNTVAAATHGILSTDPMATFFSWTRGATVGECEIDYIGYRGGGR
jgi:hypothetical protein